MASAPPEDSPAPVAGLGAKGSGHAASPPAQEAGSPPEQRTTAVTATDAPIEAEGGNEHAEEDEFLAEGWDAASSNASTSVTSSIYAHTFENGRRYHSYKHGRYPIPNDDAELNREDMKHALVMELTDGKLFYAPIGDNPTKMMDIGTGTGIWAMEAGDQFPSASVLGIDLSPIQPVWVPPNVQFIVDDIEDDWVHGDNYDLIHLRSMAQYLRKLDRTIEQAFKHLKPGGWIEFQESHGDPQCDDGTMGEDDIMKKYYETVANGMAKFGMDLKIASKLGDNLRNAGFQNVQCIIKKAPLNIWPRDKTMRIIGLYSKMIALHSVPSAAKVLASLGISDVERQVWLASVRKAVETKEVHRYYNYYFWYGQKPE